MFANLLTVVGIIIAAIVFIGIPAMIYSFYKKIPQGQAIIRTGVGGTKVAYENGITVIPVLHLMEKMDISVKTIEISRMKQDGLICHWLSACIRPLYFEYAF